MHPQKLAWLMTVLVASLSACGDTGDDGLYVGNPGRADGAELSEADVAFSCAADDVAFVVGEGATLYGGPSESDVTRGQLPGHTSICVGSEVDANPGWFVVSADDAFGYLPVSSFLRRLGCEADNLEGLAQELERSWSLIPFLANASDAGRFALSVRPLSAEHPGVDVHGASRFNPMSSAKIWYLAAAMDALGPDAVDSGYVNRDYHPAVAGSTPGTGAEIFGFHHLDAQGTQFFNYSHSNGSTYTAVLDAGGARAINERMSRWGMHATAIANWCPRASCDALAFDPSAGSNQFSTPDAAELLRQLADGSLDLDPRNRETLLQWMQLPPGYGFNGALGTRLPGDAQALLRQKIGAYAGPAGSGLPTTYNAVGIVTVPTDASQYAIAIATEDATPDYTLQQAFVEMVSLAVYRVLSGQGADNCTDTSMPWVIAEDEAPILNGFCAALSNGDWCDGDAVVTCRDGVVSDRSSACAQGCCTMPDGFPDDCRADLSPQELAQAVSCTPPAPTTPAAEAFCATVDTGWWCDGVSAVRCTSFGTELERTSCDEGCCTFPPGEPDQCLEDVAEADLDTIISCEDVHQVFLPVVEN